MFLYRFEYRDAMAYDLTDLELFLQVVDQGSITQGAEHTHLSLASASTRITAMEKALGAKLLERHRRVWCRPRPGGCWSHTPERSSVSWRACAPSWLAPPTGCNQH